MSFWKNFGFSTISLVDEVLNGSDCSLDKLLDLGQELVSEAKTKNKKLITYLKSEENLSKLISYITEDPSVDASKARCCKFPDITCDLLSVGVPELSNEIIGNEMLLTRLFSFVLCDNFERSKTPHIFESGDDSLNEDSEDTSFNADSEKENDNEKEKEKPFTPGIRVAQLGLAAKVVANLLKKEEYCGKLVEFMKKQKEFVSKLVSRLDQGEVEDFTFKLLTIPDSRETVEWLLENNFIELLIKKLKVPLTTSIDFNAEVKKFEINPLECYLTILHLFQLVIDSFDPDHAPVLLGGADEFDLELMFTSPIQQQQILEEQRKLTDRKQKTLKPLVKELCEKIKDLAEIFFDDNFPEPILQAALSFLHSFFHYLSIYNESKYIQDSECFVSLFETLLQTTDSPVLGLTRLRGIEALAELMRCNSKYLSDALIHSIVDLFYQYPWNSLLHQSFTQILRYSIDPEKGDSKIRDKILFDSKFIERAVEMEFMTEERKKSDKFDRNSSIVGYLGFFTLIFQSLEKIAESDAELKEKLENIKNYTLYIDTLLKVRIAKEKMPLGNSTKDGDDDDDDDDDICQVKDFNYESESRTSMFIDDDNDDDSDCSSDELEEEDDDDDDDDDDLSDDVSDDSDISDDDEIKVSDEDEEGEKEEVIKIKDDDEEEEQEEEEKEEKEKKEVKDKKDQEEDEEEDNDDE